MEEQALFLGIFPNLSGGDRRVVKRGEDRTFALFPLHKSWSEAPRYPSEILGSDGSDWFFFRAAYNSACQVGWSRCGVLLTPSERATYFFGCEYSADDDQGISKDSVNPGRWQGSQ